MANIVDGSVLDRELNPEQAAAAKKIDGPMLILAGAGSGKTRCITYKIAHLVSQYNVEPDRILAVTFTNKAAREMKSRIQKLLDCNMNFAWMGTFHSVCLKLLKRCLARQDVQTAMGGKWFDGNFSIYDDDDQRRILKDILKEFLGDNLESSEVKKVHSIISKYKNTVLKFGNSIQLQIPEFVMDSAESADEKMYARYYAEYQKRLKSSNAMDFDDLLFNTVFLLQKMPNLVNQLRHWFHYVVVDEYQDTNDVQYELLKFLINDNHNVTVVGDDDQSIYGWRGANIDIIRNFHRDFAPVTIVKLERNYRSTANIVRGAGSVIAHNIRPQEMQKNVFSKEEDGELIHIRYFLNDPSLPPSGRKTLDKREAYAIAATIAKAGSSNYSKTAIFYRTNAQSRVIEEALNKYRIPLVIFGGTKFWDRKEIKDILAYMRLLANDKDDAAFLRVINTPPRTIGKTTVENILEKEKKDGGSFWANLLAEANGLSRSAAKLKAFTDKVECWRKLMNDGETSLPVLVRKIVDDIDYKGYLENDDSTTADDKYGNVEELLNAVADFHEKNADASLETFLQDIALLTDADKNVDESLGHVTLMTIHMAKGLEFPIVHIAGCCDKIFPLIRESKLSGEDPKQIEEERRLFYVGCTRAEKVLYLYYTDCRLFQGQPWGYDPSRFLEEMDSSVTEIERNVEGGGFDRLGFGNGFSGDDFNQDFSEQHFSRPPRPNISSYPRRPSSGNFGGNGFRGGFTRSSIPDSVKKNDRRIVYRNPLTVEKKPEPSGPRIVYDEFSENPFHAGVRVFNKKFGYGTIVSCSGSGETTQANVRFDREGITRTIVASFLKIVG